MANTNPRDQHDPSSSTGLTPDSSSPSGESHVVSTNPDSYGTGYRQGRAIERQHYEATQQVRDETNSANGFLIGILLTGLVLGGAALAYFVTQRDRTPVIQRTIVAPSASPSPSASPEVKERVIERDRIVPVPQPQQSLPTVIPAPEIKIEVPKPSPVAPAPQAAPPQSKQQSSSPSTEPSKPVEPSPSPEASPNQTPSNSQQ